jgi:hypothetical protein
MARSGVYPKPTCTPASQRLGRVAKRRYNLSELGRYAETRAEPGDPGAERLMLPPSRFSVFLGVLAAVTSPPSAAPQAVTLRGKVMTLAAALEARQLGLKVDPEPIAKQFVLVAEDRSITPLFSDEASRALFLDERLRAGRVEIQGRRFAGVPYLHVSVFKVERDGEFKVPEYYCEVCAISVRFPQICPCCQGNMELRMKPDRG